MPYGIVAANDPVNKIDPTGLFADLGSMMVVMSLNNTLNTVATQTALSHKPTDPFYEEYDNHFKIRGTLSWRCNNPGNIIWGSWAQSHGAINKSRTSKFSKFPSVEVGTSAQKQLILINGIMSVKEYVEHHAPEEDGNDPEAYTAYLVSHGVDSARKVGEQVDLLAEWMKRFEGWKEGTIMQK